MRELANHERPAALEMVVETCCNSGGGRFMGMRAFSSSSMTRSKANILSLDLKSSIDAAEFASAISS
jgi:hypothetical protein